MRILAALLICITCLSTAFAADESIYIQVRFSEKTKYGTFSDALYYTQDEYAKLSKDDLAKVEQGRVDNFIAAVETPNPEAKELTAEELDAQDKAIDEQIATLQSQKVDIQAKISAISIAVKDIGNKGILEGGVDETP